MNSEPATTADNAVADAIALARAVHWPALSKSLDRSLLFDEWRQESSHVALVRRPSSVPENLWFIGDLHGDLPALVSAWHYIQEQSQPSGKAPHVLFLGDFIDRGPHSHETLLFLFRLILEHPQQIGVLAGNHDEDLLWDEAGQRFRSTLQPAEYAESLNALLGSVEGDVAERLEVAVRASGFFKRLPRAILLPDGLLVTHGGFPHVDLLDTMDTAGDLSRPECLQDFTWLRLSDSPRKKPNRAHRGCQFGTEDFASYCAWTAERLDLPVKRMVRGHDHLPERFQYHMRYETHPVLTLNTMSQPLPDEWAETTQTRACVARHIPGQLPEVHRLPALQPAQNVTES